jgi:branched-chain amino acid transport system ATP-binding protein
MTLRISDLHAGYGRIEVCRDVALEVSDGEFVAVLGANGAGKSTLLGAIAGSVASRGMIDLNGLRLAGANARQRARCGLALVPEGRRNLFSPLTVAENLQLGLRFLPSAERARMQDDLFSMFPVLSSRRKQAAGLLSGGEQQMLALAVALARKPSLLLLDEPSQGLAPVVLDNLVSQIGSLRRMGLTVLLAEQNHRFAAQLCDSYLVLSSGKISAAGDRKQLQEADQLVRALMAAS